VAAKVAGPTVKYLSSWALVIVALANAATLKLPIGLPWSAFEPPA